MDLGLLDGPQRIGRMRTMHINIWTRAAPMLLLVSGSSFLACVPRDGPVGRGMENDQAKQEEPIGKPGKPETDSFGQRLVRWPNVRDGK